MKIFETHDTLIVSDRKINEVKTIISRIELQLNQFKTKSDTTDKGLSFSSRNCYVVSGSQYSRIDSLRIIKEGWIEIDKEGSSLKINWSVRLENLYFVAFCFSFFLGLFSVFYTELVVTICFVLFFFLMYVVLGILFIKYKMSDIILLSVVSKNQLR